MVNKMRKSKKRRIVLGILALLLIVIGVVAYFGIDVALRTQKLFEEIHEEVVTDNVREEQDLPPVVLGETPFSVLIMGIDNDFPGDPGRADSLMLATVNPNTDTTYLLSIARDTMVVINGRTTRINHAHAYAGGGVAGAQATINVVQDFLNVPIDYYVSLQEDGFGDLIDAVGGVRVYNDTVAFAMGGHNFSMGYNDLNGDAALAFARMRMEDPRGDFGRQQRQRLVIGAMVDELAGVGVITRYQDVMAAAGDHLRTDVSANEAMTISLGYNRALRNITNLNLQATGGIFPEFGGMYLIPIPEEQRLEMSVRLRNHLELD